MNHSAATVETANHHRLPRLAATTPHTIANTCSAKPRTTVCGPFLPISLASAAPAGTTAAREISAATPHPFTRDGFESLVSCHRQSLASSHRAPMEGTSARAVRSWHTQSARRAERRLEADFPKTARRQCVTITERKRQRVTVPPHLGQAVRWTCPCLATWGRNHLRRLRGRTAPLPAGARADPL
jgi:hypothetical protein